MFLNKETAQELHQLETLKDIQPVLSGQNCLDIITGRCVLVSSYNRPLENVCLIGLWDFVERKKETDSRNKGYTQMTEHVSTSRHDWSSERLLTPCTSRFRQASLVSNDASLQTRSSFHFGFRHKSRPEKKSLVSPLLRIVTCMEMWWPHNTPAMTS